MRNLLDQDSGFMGFMNRFADLLLLNVLFFFTSLPIFTIGASSAAMYTVLFRYGTDRENGTLKPFFQAFRENFKKSTALWLPLLVLLAGTSFNILFFLRAEGPLHNLWIPSVVILLLLIFVSSYAFPLQSRFENSLGGTLKNALILSIGYLPRTLLIAALHLLPTAVLLVSPYIFLRSSALLPAIYFSASGMLCTKLLKKAFQPLLDAAGEGNP